MAWQHGRVQAQHELCAWRCRAAQDGGDGVSDSFSASCHDFILSEFSASPFIHGADGKDISLLTISDQSNHRRASHLALSTLFRTAHSALLYSPFQAGLGLLVSPLGVMVLSVVSWIWINSLVSRWPLPVLPQLAVTYAHCSWHPAQSILHHHVVVIIFVVKDQLIRINILCMNI